MAQASRDILRRIKSVKNTKKITKAMELVSAAKMRKAVSRVLASRSYSDLAWQTVLHLVKKVDTTEHPFFQERPVKNVGIVMISSNRGLCGSFNSQLAQKVVDSIRIHHPESVNTSIITMGTKGRDESKRRKLNLVADFPKEDITVSSEKIRPISKLVVDEFMKGNYDRVFVAYTDFYSTLKQKPHVMQILPITSNIDDRLGHIQHGAQVSEPLEAKSFSGYIFESDRQSILNSFLPRLVEVQIYQAVLESESSEHSARMFAMKNASEAAGDMIYDLTLAYNQARQAGITAELAEISAGRAALE